MITTTLSFRQIKEAFQENASRLIDGTTPLYMTDVSKDELWNCYIGSFPEVYRQEYNCNACRQFLKQYGNIVVLDNYRIHTLWDVQVGDSAYQTVFDNLNALVLSRPIRDAFISDTAKLGTDSNVQLLESGGVHRWHHLSLKLPKGFVITTNSNETLATIRSERRAHKEVLKRSLDELTISATQTALELIASNSIYRGQEFKELLKVFLKRQQEYAQLPDAIRDNYCWSIASEASGSLSRIRNTAIGTLLIDLSADMDINEAVNRFERVMAPANYKRPLPVFTKRMVEDAERKVAELGLTGSLQRRFATLHDVTVNNLLFVDRSAISHTASIFQDLKQDALINPKKFHKIQPISLDTFINDVLPTVQSLELLVENKHQSNLVSLIAPVNPDAPSLFKWDNGFSWSYSGAFADSVKEKVKKAGGEVDGKLRISLAWSNYDDLDLHLIEPDGNEISFRAKGSPTGGQLDVDMNAGSGQTREPVENIFYPHNRPLPEGNYKVFVNQYCSREKVDFGFVVEVEYEGNIQTFEYANPLITGQSVTVLGFSYDALNGFKVLNSIGESSAIRSKEFWGLRSNQFHEVKALLFSPNHWTDAIGNKHLFFALDKCQNDEPKARGFFNEFLKEELTPHRKVFEALANKLEVDNTHGSNQLSGLGFSLTQPTEFVVKVKTLTERVLKVTI